MMGLSGRRCVVCCEYGAGMVQLFMFWGDFVIIDNGSGVDVLGFL